ncbi:MAG: N-acetylmuramoyl-L-alanine amidase [Rubrivivax sp.]|nr:N-acetylmuramoyl-L-alanine amidase [Rubrivivax sp.]MDP3224387.1 N-acetylmuramoyl-L-alanine amidase [Rubrivivax sp.]
MALELSLPATASITRTINLIVLHCSATPSGQWVGGHVPGRAGYTSPSRSIDLWHARRGFKRQPAWVARHMPLLKSIGYHYVVDLDGRLWQGRHLVEAGAHAVGHNADSVGICLVGGAELDAQYTAAQWATLQDLVLQLCNHLSVPMRPFMNGSGVCGHRDLSPDADGDGRINRTDWLKTCPGFDVSAWLAAGLKPADRHVWTGEVPR